MSAVFPRLFDEAERVRWQMGDIPWHDLRRDAVTPELIALVREIVASESTTYSATLQFLQTFAADLDFTSWVSVWFYEETKHPQVLTRWLEHFDEGHDEAFLRRARVSTPFVKSQMATLVANIISELIAAARYANLRANSPEPVLAQIAERLAGDEARHAASFFTFARDRLAASAQPEVERRDALKALYMWLDDSAPLRHPVNMFRASSSPAGPSPTLASARSRIIRTVGLLLDLPLATPHDVLQQLKSTVTVQAM